MNSVTGEMVGCGEVICLWAQAEQNASKKTKSDYRAHKKAQGKTQREMQEISHKEFVRKSESELERESLRGRQAVTGKRRGEMAEAAFLAKASAMGFRVAKPWGDSDPYDFIVQAGAKMWRVQVKSAHVAGQNGCYSFRAHGHAGRAYGKNEIDALVAYVAPENAWYVFPVTVIRKMRSLKLFAGSGRNRSRFERYREAWWVMER